MPQGWLGLDWGNVPAWTGSVLTGSSLLIAANTYRRAVQDRVREQASKFAVWISKTPEDGRVQLSFANGSDVPVYNVRVELIAYGPPPTGRGRPVLLENPWPEHADVVPPSGLPARDLSYYSAKVDRVTFTDASGLTWVRDDWGRLTQESVIRLRGTGHPRGPEGYTPSATWRERARMRWRGLRLPRWARRGRRG